MNAKRIALAIGLVGLLSGCASWWYPSTPNRAIYHPQLAATPRATATEIELLVRAAQQPVAPFAGEGWRELFDGRTLTGWQPTEFDQGGRVFVTDGVMVLERGNPFVGVNGTNALPTVNYELAFDALRVAGDDFFCGLTFPVQNTHCSLIVGGWGGGIVGLSNVDGADASENETTQYISFEKGRWYRIRLRVTEQRIEAWIEQKKVVNLPTAGRKLEVRFGEILLSRPFGLAAWETSAAYRAIKIRPVTAPDDPRD